MPDSTDGVQPSPPRFSSRPAISAFSVGDLMAFVAATAGYLLYPHQGFFGIAPDNIAQIAYAELLTQPDLVGTIGSATPKAGLIVLLGMTHKLTYGTELWEPAFRLLLAGFASLSLTIVTRIAFDLGGRAAAVLALLVALGVEFSADAYFLGTSQLFFVPLCLMGLWLLSKARETAAAVWLSIAGTIRPEGLVIVALVAWSRYLRHRRFRPASAWLLAGTVALIATVAIAFAVQGSLERIGAGPAVGYPMDAGMKSLAHLRELIRALLAEPVIAILIGPALFVWLTQRCARVYLYFVGVVVVPLALLATDMIGFHYRYIASLQVFLIPFGCAGVFAMRAAARRLDRKRMGWSHILFALVVLGSAWGSHVGGWGVSVFAPLFVPVIVMSGEWIRRHASLSWSGVVCQRLAVVVISVFFVALGASTWFKHRRWASERVHPVVSDWVELARHPTPPEGANVLTEDAVLNYVIALDRARFGSVRSIQLFNILPYARRERFLADVGYLCVSKREGYRWNYLRYLPSEDWVSDSFRAAVEQLCVQGGEIETMGYRLVVVENSPARLVARVEPMN